MNEDKFQHDLVMKQLNMTEEQQLLQAQQANLVPQSSGLKNNLDINAAMRYLYDTFEMAVLTNAVIIGDAGKAINDGLEQIPLDITEIEVGIKESQMTAEVISLFKTWGYTQTDRGWETSFEGIPIKFRVLKRKYKFLENIDTKFYGVDEFHLPNPWEEYEKIKQIVR